MSSTRSVKLVPPLQLDGSLTLPGGKSETNRALIISALTPGNSIIYQSARCDDTDVVLRALDVLGFDVVHDGSTIELGGAHSPQPRGDRIYLDSAGTAMRFVTALCAVTSASWIHLDGSDQLRRRPMAELLNALRSLGAEVECEEKEGFLPYRVKRGSIGKKAEISISGERSSQFISALLLVAPVLENGLKILVQGRVVSAPYIQLTLQLMRYAGVLVSEVSSGYEVSPGVYAEREFTIEPDASSATYFFGLAAVLGGRIRVRDLRRDSVQADIEVLTHLEQMGCNVCEMSGCEGIELQGPKALRGISADLSHTPDGALTLACVSVFAKEPSVFSGLSHLPHKESDRLKGLVTELRRIGVNAWCDEDKLSVLPGELRPALVKTYNDHRMAMAFSLCAMGNTAIEIANPEVVNKSFPKYWEALQSLGVQVKYREVPLESDFHRFHG